MRIKIRSFAGFRNILGKEKDIDLPGEGAMIRDLLNLLCHDHASLEPLLFKEGRLREDVNIFLSGKNIESLQSLETPLADGDDLALFTAVIGG